MQVARWMKIVFINTKLIRTLSNYQHIAPNDPYFYVHFILDWAGSALLGKEKEKKAK